MANPKINPAYLLSALENGYIVYDPVGDRLHELNPVGSLIAELCDGGRSLGDIREVVEPLLPAGGGAENERWIEEGLEAGLPVWSDGPAAAHREFSAAPMSDLPPPLRGQGKIRMAFLCPKKVVERMP